ncbi:TetR family transcriptional regulator [Oceanobacillus oncorhynchi subsp. incaldanensis]|uniref:HTH-type transcriptional regulator RutR n=2 Tax=Oceanobacillus TaxID=182709 RepID=A0A0A1MWZ0_9BACI|nr:TetR/AcrR family transcriptional regulator [Oceanobacillus oncorhynchi]MDM8099754.1 TetR/AcrR family transcriptional regulator [Oceanobacillus oncorhynchi]UUI41797.1 TetR/AcrR family transcriptional regulator [Oceanobacillus oncorhynchi]GIO21075.1 TetR family transcriptional regulator [Oceanobacillus oncorhynchi subsp. incaldanensis]CEI83291.1 HTH-type transcriptional regulator RutR [Oceanobacillus oncorhynchi]
MENNEPKLTKKQIAILEAATDLFAEKGYAGTSTSEIATKAEVAEGTIFKHFKSKKGLLMAVVSPMMVKWLAPMIKKDLNKVLDQEFEYIQDFIRAMIENRKEFIQKNLPMLKILVQEIPFHPDLKEKFIEYVGNDIFDKLREIVTYYQDKGQLADMKTDTIIRTVATSILSYIVARYVFLPEINWDEEEIETERIIQILESGIIQKNSGQ